MCEEMTMYTRESIPRGLSCSGGLAALGVAALLALYSWAQGQPPAEPVPVEAVLEVVPDEPGVEQAQAELKRLQADLEQKKADLERARAALRDAEQKARAAKKAKGTRVLRIEIIGLDEKPEAVKEVIKKLQDAVSGEGRKVIVREVPGDEKGGVRFWSVPGGAKPMIAGQAVPMLPGKAPQPGPMMGAGVGRGRSGSDPRVDQLEKKLETLLQELESLRKELKRSPGKGERGKQSEP
jgi:hypothetical protein